MRITIAGREIEIRPLYTAGNERLDELLERCKRMLDPFLHAWASAEEAGGLPEDPEEREAVLLRHMPAEARMTVKEDLALQHELLTAAFAGVPEAEEVLAETTTEDFHLVLDILWGRGGGRTGKG